MAVISAKTFGGEGGLSQEMGCTQDPAAGAQLNELQDKGTVTSGKYTV
jgi:hypothetical protein